MMADSPDMDGWERPEEGIEVDSKIFTEAFVASFDAYLRENRVPRVRQGEAFDRWLDDMYAEASADRAHVAHGRWTGKPA